MIFTSELLKWYDTNQRYLPWRNNPDPYYVWLSEVILQQTRIAQGIGYYDRFINTFPSVQALAEANEDQVLALWQGLGYYSRARNLHKTARIISDQYNGIFPTEYKELIKLPGIGPYSAAAISSIAYNMCYAAIDGNVARVLARYYCIEYSVDSKEFKNAISEAANQLLDTSRPGCFNQAMMDFGSLVCKPKQPLCNHCPIAISCEARALNKQNLLPVKGSPVKTKTRYFHYFHLFSEGDDENRLLVEKRHGNDIWKNLYQLPLIETDNAILSQSDLHLNPTLLKCVGDDFPFYVKQIRHKLTHQELWVYFYSVKVRPNEISKFTSSYQWISYAELATLGKPIVIKRFLDAIYVFDEKNQGLI